MIVLDASVVIAHFALSDAHHPAAKRFFGTHLDEQFAVHTLTFTEMLVGPIRAGREAFALQQFTDLGITEWTPGVGSAARLARLRVETSLKLPDCCVLDAAMATRSTLATLDLQLARAAASVGVHLAEVAPLIA